MRRGARAASGVVMGRSFSTTAALGGMSHVKYNVAFHVLHRSHSLTVTVRLPPRVEQELAEYCAKRRLTKSEAVKQALRAAELVLTLRLRKGS